MLSSENVVALCDVNEKHLAFGAQKFPGAKQYVDWRKCLDQKDIEAVVCCTADHTHAFVANWAMNRGKHIYCEKPLANCVEEARVVRANYLKNKTKLATQVGTQRHEFENFNRVRELILDGAIGELQEVSAWGDRQDPEAGLPARRRRPAAVPPLRSMARAFARASLQPGLLLRQLRHELPLTGTCIGTSAAARSATWAATPWTSPGTPLMPTCRPPPKARATPSTPRSRPVKLETHFEIPANDWRQAIRVSWYQGGAMPESPVPLPRPEEH